MLKLNEYEIRWPRVAFTCLAVVVIAVKATKFFKKKNR